MRVHRDAGMKTSDRKKRQRGAALVETALVFLTALAMILFIVDMGRILLTQQFIAERAPLLIISERTRISQMAPRRGFDRRRPPKQ